MVSSTRKTWTVHFERSASDVYVLQVEEAPELCVIQPAGQPLVRLWQAALRILVDHYGAGTFDTFVVPQNRTLQNMVNRVNPLYQYVSNDRPSGKYVCSECHRHVDDLFSHILEKHRWVAKEPGWSSVLPTREVSFTITTQLATWWACPICGEPRDMTPNHDEVYHPEVAAKTWADFRASHPGQDIQRIAFHNGRAFYPEGKPTDDPTYATGTYTPDMVEQRPVMQIEGGWLARVWKVIRR